MNTQTLPKITITRNPFAYPVATSQSVGASEAQAWSGEIDQETLANEMAKINPLPPVNTPEIDPDLFEQVYAWFIS